MWAPFTRFWEKVDKQPDGCWLWLGAKDESGYGTFRLGGNGVCQVQAHRLSYEMLVGRIQPGLVLDHLCRVRACIRPSHLEPVARGENSKRGASFNWAVGCKRGHPWTEESTYRAPNGRRTCRICHRDRNRGYRRNRKMTLT